MDPIVPRFDSRIRLYIAIILTILPCVLCLLYIKVYGINIAYWDQWEIVPLIDKSHNCCLSFSDLLAQHNEHRILFPQLIMLLVSFAFHYDNKMEMLFGWFILCLTCYLLYIIYIRCSVTPEAPYSSLMKFLPIAWLIFSFRQYENLLWGWQFQIFMATFFFILAVYILENISYLKNKNFLGSFVLAAASGVISSFSFANGLLTWPIGLVQILLSWQQTKEEKWLYLRVGLMWGLGGILVYLAYFINYCKPGHHPSVFYFLYHPLSSLCYFIGSIGSPLAVEKYTAIGTGCLLVFLYLYLIGFFMVNKHINDTKTSHSVVPFSLVLFSLLSAIIFMVGRAGFGVEQALSSRYTTVTTLGIIGTYIFILNLPYSKTAQEQKNILLGLLVSMMAVGIIASYIHGIKSGEVIKDLRSLSAHYVSTFELQSDENLQKVYPDPVIVRERAKILQKYKLNVFAKSLLNVQKLSFAGSSSALFFVDTVNGYSVGQADSTFIVNPRQEQTITISGWAVDQQTRKEAGGVFVTIDDNLEIPAIYGLDRKDVANHFQNKRYRFSGFSASFATSILKKKLHTVSFKIVTTDKKAYYTPNQKITLEIKQEDNL